METLFDGDLTREEFLKHAWAWTEEHGGIILKQLRTLGCSCDWDRTAFTMDETRSKAVIDVICCNNEDSNVSYLRTTSTHCGERFVTGGVKEYDLFALVVNFVRTDVLGNTASFACSNVGFTDSVQQRGFTVVNVTHNGNYRRTQTV